MPFPQSTRFKITGLFPRFQMQLYNKFGPCNAPFMMATLKRTIALAGMLALTGCVSTSVINLTPRYQSRNSENVYPVEIEFNSNLRTIKQDTVRPYVQIGADNFLMRRTPIVKNRWETLIPVPNKQSVLNYRIKVDFTYDSLPEPKVNSVLAGPFQLLLDK